jgi:DNA-binding NarL/FixJ family response regulator
VSERIRIVIADDHAPTRAGIRAVLEEDGFDVCGEAASADAAVELALEERPAVCLLDINMPGGGIAAAGAISERLPETAIVMLTVSRDDADLFDALRAGAAGYLLKDIDRRQLPSDLRGVLAGEAPLPRALVTKLIEEFRDRGRRRKLLLAEIASRLFIAEVTVRTHVSSILKKLRVPTREAAVELLRGR